MPKKKKLDPFSISTIRYIAYPKNIDQPYLFKFPNNNGVKRLVDIDISTWRGVSLDATHWYAKIKVEANAIWDPKELIWVVPSDLAECKEFKYTADVETKQDAIKFVECVIKTFYNDPEQYLIHNDIYEEPWVDMKKRILDGD